VPISGRIDDGKVSTPQAIFNVLHTSFVQAYKSQLDHLKPAADDTNH
jgi:hypothetical protein